MHQREKLMRALFTFFVLASVALVVGCGGSAAAQSVDRSQMRVVVEDGSGAHVAGAGGAWIGGSAAQTRIVIGADGETYIGVWVDAPQNVAVGRRQPMALSLVVDTSGSMEGQKIQNARMAAASLVESLRTGDIVSIYAFSNGVTEISPLTTVTAANRGMLVQQVNNIRALGGTNMYDGIRVGEDRLAQAPATHPIRRLVIISDGRANIGPSDPQSLGALAAQGTEWGAQISAIGVGLDYDERILAALAVRSAGRMYHLEHPAQMAMILEQELELLGRTIATNTIIEILPAHGVRILGVESTGGTVENGRVRVNIGALHAGQRREVLLRAEIDTESLGRHPVGTARLSFDGPTGERQVQRVDLGYEVVRNRGAAARSSVPRVAGLVANHEAAQAQLRAVVALNEGRAEEAAREFDFAADTIQGAAAVQAPGERRRMMERQRSIRGQGQRARRPMSAPAARSLSLEANDDAMSGMGY
ncbi:MAG: VWA domain-containing protein [Deltaproteobacteria bacterium]|nr:VWA domain-containing protein [Deltaproteobacteria bacterium]